MPSSPPYTSHLELHNSNWNSDDDLLDVKGFTSETTSPRSLQTSHDGYVTVKNAASRNQAEGSGPDSPAEQASSLVPENNSNLPAQESLGEPTQPVISASNTSIAFPQAYTSILPVDVVNGIVKGGSLDFFNIKEQRYLQHMQNFRNEDGS